MSAVRYFVRPVEYVGRLKANFKPPRSDSVVAPVSYHPQTGEHQANYDIRQQSLLWCLTGLGLAFRGGSGAYMGFQRRVS